MLNTGDPAPPFELPDQHGTIRRLSEFLGSPLVLYFYPKDNTEDCTIEACAFRDAAADFARLNIPVLGISPDPPKTHARFDQKHALGFPLLSDPKPASPVCRAFGTFVEKTMYGKPATTIARTTFLLDARHVIAARWDKKQIEADVAAHPAAVLAAIHSLIPRT